MDNFSNLFNKEPEFKCPVCDTQLYTDWVDNGFGAFSIQVSPYVCESCGWSEKGCEKCIKDRCFSWDKCRGRALKAVKLDANGILKWIADCPYNVDEATVSKLGIEATPPYQAVMNISLCYTVWKQLQDFIKELDKDNMETEYIDYNGFRYWYEYKLARDRKDICLATKNPKEYCNGFYLYSTKDEGNGKAFVVVKTNNPDEDWMKN